MTNFLFEPPFGGLRGNVRTSFIARWKARVFAIIEPFSLAVRLTAGVGYFEQKFYVEGDVAPNHCWYQKTRVFLLPHSKDRIIPRSFVWVQYQRVTDGRNCRSYYSTLHC